MLRTDPIRGVLATLAAAGLTAACGSTHSARPSTTASGAAPAPATTSRPQSSPAAGALSADAASVATGDIPDNQVFLTFSSRRAGFAIKYPEGWTQSGSPHDLSFKDRNNVVHIVIASAPAPTAAHVTAQLQRLTRTHPSLRFTAPQPVHLGAGPAFRARYTTRSAPNPVTGKQVTLVVDRYELASRGRLAVVDLGTPVGVDNVDAYRMMIESFRWR